SRCGKVSQEVRLTERVFRCHCCGLVIDRDRNAATDLATWAQAAQMAIRAPARQAGGRVPTPLEGKALAIVTAMANPSP
ncbi:MAG TPA: zinc ribbon domain-containing protein, partial [Actinomycetota bacterium]|nr:zinc ribbon domain-containing protein [Actinomycetota bacterium]